MVFLCGSAGGEDDVMPEEHEETLQTSADAQSIPTAAYAGLSQTERHLLVLLEKVRRLKQFGPFCFPLQNLVGDAEACQCNTHQL